MPAIPELAHIFRQKRRTEIARGLNAEAVAGPHGHERITGEIEEQVEAVHVGILHLTGELAPPGAVAEGRGREIVVEHRAQHFLVDGAHQDEQDAAGQQVGVLAAGINAVGVLGEPTGSVDGARGEGSEEHEEVQVVDEIHVLDDTVAHLDDHLHRLEGDVGDAEEAHEVAVENGGDFVDDERGDNENEGRPVLPQCLLAPLPAGQFPEGGRAGNKEEGGEGGHALPVLAEQQQEEHRGSCQAVVLDAVPGKAQNGRRNDGDGEKDVERRIDVKVHERPDLLRRQRLAVDLAVHSERERIVEDDLLGNHVVGQRVPEGCLHRLARFEIAGRVRVDRQEVRH